MNRVERLRKQFIKMERVRLLNRLDCLSAALKNEADWQKAEAIKQEMRGLGDELKALTANPVPDHEYLEKQEWFREQAKQAKKLRVQS